MENLTKFDDVFLGILQHLGKIEPFLDAVFFFLARRTDFFRLMSHREDAMGFPPGVAEKIVMTIFKKHQKMVLGEKREGQASNIKNPNDSGSRESNKLEEPVKTPPVAQEVEIQMKEDKENMSTKVEDSHCVPDSDIVKSVSKEKTSKLPVPGASVDCFNGAITDKYSWSQSSTDIDLKIPIPKSVKKGKDIGVEIYPDSLKVTLKKLSGSGDNVLLEGKFHNKVKCEESLWSIVAGEHLQINLEKFQEIWWTCVFEGEAEIDKGKIDTTKDISEFDQQTQADFQRVMYDHHQKMQGKPTSQEQKTYDLLHQAWNAEGSPFQGTPFDPSRVNINSSGC